MAARAARGKPRPSEAQACQALGIAVRENRHEKKQSSRARPGIHPSIRRMVQILLNTIVSLPQVQAATKPPSH